MAAHQTTSERKRRGAWYTPQPLVDAVVIGSIDDRFVAGVAGAAGRPVRVLDPACGDGRFLAAAADRIEELGGVTELVGVDIDEDAVLAARTVVPAARLVRADSLGIEAGGVVDRAGRTVSIGTQFDLVIGNPPFLSQLAAATAREATSRHGVGPYGDVAVEFLALAAELVSSDGGRIAFVLPQSILASRDAQSVRERIDRRATMIWSSWAGRREFDADVLTCALAFEFGSGAGDTGEADGHVGRWAHVVTERVGVPAVPPAMLANSAGTLGDRAWLNANFRDEYYGMVGAVGDHDAGPPLVTSGLIDPGRSLWGFRPVRFAKERYSAPRIDLDALDDRMRRWADRRLVPKVLVANQTPVLEAVADPGGSTLPGVPVVSIYPHDPTTDEPTHKAPDAPTASGSAPNDAAASELGAATWEIAAVLSSPAASVWAWHERGGTGLSADTIRVGPAMLAPLPWPGGDLGRAVRALREGDVLGCGEAVDSAYGLDPDEHAWLMAWWQPIVERLLGRGG